MFEKFQKRKTRFVLVTVAMLFPLSAMASVSFTEIMYDHPGADTGHEWVEIQNTGTDSVDLKNYKFFEGGVNHKLVAQKTSLLLAGAYAIIANDAQQFSGEYPAFSGALYQSSFSLSNTAETLALKDASTTEIASATYSSTDGSKGDGNTLNFVGGSWVPRSPTPGVAASAAAIPPPPPPAAPTKPVKSGNSSSNVGVSTGSSQTAPKTFASKQPSVAAAVEGAGSSGILPWVIALLVTIAAGVIAVIYMRTGKKPEDEYEIIEDKS